MRWSVLLRWPIARSSGCRLEPFTGDGRPYLLITGMRLRSIRISATFGGSSRYCEIEISRDLHVFVAVMRHRIFSFLHFPKVRRRIYTLTYKNVTCGALAAALNSSTELCDLRGVPAMLVYLFRDESSSDTFAYSTDVTGRNIPRASPYTQWSFVAPERTHNLDDIEEVRLHLRRQGFYVFRR
jgi:hypothetical protein